MKLGIVTDLHFGPEALWRGKLRKLSAHAGRLLGGVVDRMNERFQPDVLVNLGDDIEDSTLEADRARYRECMDGLARSRADVLHVAGNHDTINLAESELHAEWDRTSAWTKAAREATGKLHYAIDRGGYRLVVLHTHEVQDRNVSLDEPQLAWLERELASTALPSIVFMHHSAADQHLVGNRWFEGRANLCLVQERKKIRDILEAAVDRRPGSVLAVFNGHLHWNHLDVIRGIPYVTVQSLIENLDDDAPGRPASAYAAIEITHARVVVELGGAEPARYQFDRR